MSNFFGSALTDQSGKFIRRDEFANLKLDDDFEGYDFEDTYDGLGDQLQEDGDNLNDDTFGNTAVGNDFDFSGKTAKVSETLEQEQLAFQRHQFATTADIDRSAMPKERQQLQTKQSRSKDGAWQGQPPVSESSVWAQSPQTGTQFRQQTHQSPSRNLNSFPSTQFSQPTRKFQTLEEVEASMLASSKSMASSSSIMHAFSVPNQQQFSQPSVTYSTLPASSSLNSGPPSQIEYRGGFEPRMSSMPLPQQPPPGIQLDPLAQAQRQFSQPIRFEEDKVNIQAQAIASLNSERDTSNLRQVMADDALAARAQQEKNLRRAQKIGHMARYNGLMSNGDKNYVLKVQISQLVSEDPEADDFYYTVHSTLRGRTHVQQSLGHFEQTYLSRPGQSNRRGHREKQNPMLKMQQQVQKIIASAKTRPKGNFLAVEGSLGKLSFSRVRQPRQVLSVKMPDNAVPLNKQSKKEALQNIEIVYNTLLLLEHTGRQVPAPQAPPVEVEGWKDRINDQTEQIWSSLHIMDEIDDSQLHPFIQLLQYAKGKKLIPRVYRSLNPERRLTLISMVVAHLDLLDVVSLARYDESGSMSRQNREDIELFTQTVLPPLLVFTSEASLKIVSGLLNMLITRNSVELLATSKVGLSFMTMFISRAEIAKDSEQIDQAEELSPWHDTYNHFFSVMEGKFSMIFPPPSHHVEEIYPWQFLAACAVSASPEQQHALVNEARDRVLDNVQTAKGLPRELADIKRGNVNLFLHAIGLDASQLES